MNNPITLARQIATTKEINAVEIEPVLSCGHDFREDVGAGTIGNETDEFQ